MKRTPSKVPEYTRYFNLTVKNNKEVTFDIKQDSIKFSRLDGYTYEERVLNVTAQGFLVNNFGLKIISFQDAEIVKHNSMVW